MSKTKITIKALTVCAALCAMPTASAQIMRGYTLSVEEQNYQPLENPTVIAQGSAEEKVDISSMAYFKAGPIEGESEVNGFPMGFSFKFGNQDVTSFGVSGNGFLAFAGDEMVEFDPTDGLYSFTYSIDDNICGLAVNYVDLGENSTIGYAVTGEDGNHVLAVELSNILVYPKNWSWDNVPAKAVSILYKVYEKDNSISMSFNGWNGFEEGNGYGYMGLKQVNNNVIFAKEGESWLDATTSFGTSNMNFGVDYTIPDGLTFVWNYPIPCVTPLAQPTDLKLSVGTDYVQGEFEVPEAKVDNYLVVLTKGSEQTFVPQDGTTYSDGEEIEETIIVYWGSENDFFCEAVEPNTEYTLSVYSANSIGSNGPAYLTQSPLQQTFVSAPEGPERLIVGEATVSSISFSVDAIEGFDVIVLMTDEVAETGLGWNAEPNFGDLSGELQVGDYVPNSRAKVVWKGGSQQDIVIDDLTSGTGWYLLAASVGADGTTYSTDVVENQISTIGTMPYVPDLSNVVYTEMPVGWTTKLLDDDDPYTGVFRRSKEETEIIGEGEETEEITYYCLESLGFAGSEEEPAVVEFTTIPVEINQLNGVVSLQWSWNIGEGFGWFAQWYPITFGEGDQLQIAVSEDAEEWTAISVVNSNNAPAAIEDPVSGNKYWNTMSADLSSYIGKTVYFRFQCTTVQSGAAGNRLYVRDFRVEGVPMPEVPEVRLEDKGVDYAILAWRGSQENYQLQWGLADSEELTTVAVDKKTYTIEGLEGATSYKARVRGYDSELEYWSEWSEYVEFTTNDWPAIEAPEGLKSEIADNVVTLSWNEVQDVISYEVRYRKGSVTEWIAISDLLTNSLELSGLDVNETYLWSVRANCTHDRQTSWATQQEFIIVDTSLSSVIADSENVVYYTVDGKCLGNDITRLPKGSIVIATQGKKNVKRIIK